MNEHTCTDVLLTESYDGNKHFLKNFLYIHTQTSQHPPGMGFLRQIDRDTCPCGTVRHSVDARIMVNVGATLGALVTAVRQAEGLDQVPVVCQWILVELQMYRCQRLAHVVVLTAAYHQLQTTDGSSKYSWYWPHHTMLPNEHTTDSPKHMAYWPCCTILSTEKHLLTAQNTCSTDHILLSTNWKRLLTAPNTCSADYILFYYQLKTPTGTS